MEKKHQYRGLTKQEVEESRRLHGENVLTPPQKASLWSQFLEKFEDPIIRILLVAWLLSMIIAGVHCWGPEAKGFTASWSRSAFSSLSCLPVAWAFSSR